MSSEILRLPKREVPGDKEKKSFAWEKDDVHIFSGVEVWDYDTRLRLLTSQEISWTMLRGRLS